MFKKAFVILVLILSFCLSASAFAQSTVTFSDNFDTLVYNGVSYSRFVSSQLYNELYDILYAEVILENYQQNDIKSIELYTDEYENVIEANIIYTDGSEFTAKYLSELYKKEYELMLNKEAGASYVDFEWPEDNTVEIDFALIKSPDTELDEYFLNNCDYFFVYSDNRDETLTLIMGVILSYNSEFYYVDYKDMRIKSNHTYNFVPSEHKAIPAYKIMDERLVADLMKAEEDYIGDGLNFLTDEMLTDRLAKIFCVILLGIFPCVIAVIFLIICKRSSGIYRKLYGAITITALSTSVLFTILFYLIMHYN